MTFEPNLTWDDTDTESFFPVQSIEWREERAPDGSLVSFGFTIHYEPVEF